MELLELLRAEPRLAALLAGVFGLLVGSFLNVVIHRLPRMLRQRWASECADLTGSAAPAAEPLTLATPRSACPACHAPIRAIHNVPLVSWLWLRGRCADCGAPISVRYPLVELATGLAFGVVVWRFGVSVEAAAALVISAYLIAMTGIDIDTQLLPDDLTLPLLWLGLLAAAVYGRGAHAIPVDLKSAVLGAACGYLSLYSVYWLFRLATGKEGMGYGDFKLLAALGAWLGWQLLLPVILFSAATGAVIGLVLIALKRLGREVPIPFGPYLAAAGWLVMLWTPQLVAPWWPFAR